MSEDYCLSDVFIVDYANISLRHITRFTPSLIKKYEMCAFVSSTYIFYVYKDYRLKSILNYIGEKLFPHNPLNFPTSVHINYILLYNKHQLDFNSAVACSDVLIEINTEGLLSWYIIPPSTSFVYIITYTENNMCNENLLKIKYALNQNTHF